MKVLTASQFYQADKETIQFQNISSIELMERASFRCFEWLHVRLQGNPIKIHVLCGIGNNGGDGLVMARYLKEYGYNVSCYIVNYSDKRTEEFLENYKRLKDIGLWPVTINSKADFPEISFEDIVIDAIFGLGLKRNPTGFTKDLIQYVNSTKVWVLSIDFPSGMYGETSVTDTDSVIRAGHTLTFQAPKIAFFFKENQHFLASWEVIDIGLDPRYLDSIESEHFFLQKEDMLPLYQRRIPFGNKRDFGHSLLIGGSKGKIGAINLAAKACMYSGSGLVSARIPNCGYTVLQINCPEVMVETDGEESISDFNSNLKASAIGIGPGLGTSKETVKGFRSFIEKNTSPLVLDADALNMIATDTTLLKKLPEGTILTPHEGEFERLVGPWNGGFEQLALAKKLTTDYPIVLVLKGKFTKICYQGNIYFNSTGNVALATAGTGDVLTGIITSLVAQGYPAINAAILGVYLHGKTADLAIQDIPYETFVASTVIDYLPKAILDLFENPNQNASSEEGIDEDTIEEDNKPI